MKIMKMRGGWEEIESTNSTFSNHSQRLCCDTVCKLL